MLKYVADQIGEAPEAFSLYARREETRGDYAARLMMYLDTGSATPQHRRAALLSAIHGEAASDDGAAIVNSIVAAFFERGALLPAIDTIQPIGLAGRAIARRWVETALATCWVIVDAPTIRLSLPMFVRLTRTALARPLKSKPQWS